MVAPCLVHAQSQPAAVSSEERARLEAEISRELGVAPPAPPAPGTQPDGAAGSEALLAQPGAQGSAGANPVARLLLLPDISAIASFTGAYDSYDVEGRSPERGELYGKKEQPTFLFQELELGLQGVVDPYFRADAFVSFTPSGTDVEEAYATTLSLPANLQLRAGKFFSPFGRMNQQHPHTWEFVDAPLARGRLLATETLSGPGAAASWLAPLPWFAQLELAAQSTAPFDGDPAQFTGVARLLQYFPLGDAASLGVGLSAARRREAGPGAFRGLGGGDVFLRFRAPESRSYLNLQGELYLRQLRDVPDASGEPEHGWWAQAFWRQDPFVGYGVRYEEAPAAGSSAPGTERRASGVLDWYPSEFSRVALEASYDRRPGGQGGFEGLLHFEFILGAHGAHPF